MPGARNRKIAKRTAAVQRADAEGAHPRTPLRARIRARAKLIAAICGALVGALLVAYYVRIPKFAIESFELSAPLGPDRPILYRGLARNTGGVEAFRVLRSAYIRGGPSNQPPVVPEFNADELRKRTVDDPIADVPAGQTISIATGRPAQILTRDQYIAVMAGRHTLRIYTYFLYHDWLGISHSTRTCQAYLPKGRSPDGEFVECPE
jgi:hypothetical protein